MRLIVLQPASLQSLTAKLNAPPGDSAASIERLKRLNPQADFTQLQSGAVLLLPDAPGLDVPGSSTLDGGAFADFASDLEAGFKASAARVKAGADQLAADKADVGAALKTAVVKRLIDSDAALKAQLDDVSAQFAKDQRNAQDAGKQLDATQQAAAAEMAALGKLFG